MMVVFGTQYVLYVLYILSTDLLVRPFATRGRFDLKAGQVPRYSLIDMGFRNL
jgi:hypothetical protein